MPSARNTNFLAAAIAIGLFSGGLTIGSSSVNRSQQQVLQPSPSNQTTFVVSSGRDLVTCTGTGGVATDDLCIWQNPLTSTAAILSIALEIKSAPNPVSFDTSRVASPNTATGENITNLSNLTTSTGARFVFSTGSLLIPGSEYIKVGSLTDSTSSFDAILRVEYLDHYGE